ncbi:MAG: selenide, water dikinase SelD [Hydrogenophaga sp.]|nr:selenide, water dikinase SelD [Gammaproteobacteria bacterium]
MTNAAASIQPEVRLTTLSHGGGCGCKIAPGVLRSALEGMGMGFPHPALMVGSETSDDAAVMRLNDEQALIATTDFFMPIVDDPFDFGRIAATNALSDVYAMGGRPCMALAIVGMPVDKLPVPIIRRILEGGAEVCRAAGVALAGGHSIDAVEPIYGLAVMGTVHPDKVKRNDAARAGDVLVLGKPLGVGVLATALKKGLLDADGYAEMVASTTRLNSVGTDLAELPGVHALTDVTGFGLLGHLLELCRGSRLAAEVNFGQVPVLPTAAVLAPQGIGPGAIERNWASYGAEVRLDAGLPPWAQRLLCDPQTSGGLLAACAPDSAAAVLDLFHRAGFSSAAVVGRLEEGAPQVRVVG